MNNKTMSSIIGAAVVGICGCTASQLPTEHHYVGTVGDFTKRHTTTQQIPAGYVNHSEGLSYYAPGELPGGFSGTMTGEEARQIIRGVATSTYNKAIVRSAYDAFSTPATMQRVTPTDQYGDAAIDNINGRTFINPLTGGARRSLSESPWRV